MTNIPINAKVVCTDGWCGKSKTIIVNPVNQMVTHFVIEKKSVSGANHRLVPVWMIGSISQNQINLNCKKADVDLLPLFIVTKFIHASASGMVNKSGAAYTLPYVINNDPRVPRQGRNIHVEELTIYCGMQIEATDGQVGELNKLVLDPRTGAITHLLMLGRYLWEEKQVAIPISFVDCCDANTIYLRLDTAAVLELPMVPLRQP